MFHPSTSSKIVRTTQKVSLNNANKNDNKIFDSSISTIHPKKLVIPQKNVQLVKDTTQNQFNSTQALKKSPEPDFSQIMLDQIEESFMKLRTSLNKYTLEFDEYHMISGLQKDLSAVDDQLLNIQTVYETLAAQVEENQDLLANSPFSGQEHFHHEEHLLRVEKLEIEERLKREQWEAT